VVGQEGEEPEPETCQACFDGYELAEDGEGREVCVWFLVWVGGCMQRCQEDGTVRGLALNCLAAAVWS
jgi:hypothetical protein